MVEELNRRVFRDLSYGLYIVTSCAEGRSNGQIVNTVIQVTSEPARVAVIINKQNFTHGLIDKSGIFAVSVLEQSVTLPFLGPFGFRSGRDMDKISKVQHQKGIAGCPIVTEHALSFLEARVISHLDLGSHTIFVGETVRSQVLRDGIPLTYRYYHENLKGKSPSTAPTYQPSP